MSTGEIAKAMDVAREAVAAAAAASLRHFRTGVRVEVKPDRSPVTAADRESEAAILAVVAKAFPNAAILAEESGVRAGDGRMRWIVDPLDGTRGFTRGGTFWGPLVGCEVDGEIVAGAMGLPALSKAYWAGRGLGAFRDGTKLALSGVPAWEDATLSLGEAHKLLAPPWREKVLALATSCASTRAYGDLAACAMLLDGVADAWLEAGVQPWDLAPLAILVEEAGGVFTDFAGKRALSGTAIGANPALHARLLAALR